jgi:DNA-binding transcriptional MocR family regulator
VFSASGRYANCLRLSAGHRWSPWIENGLETLGGIVGAAAG